MTMPSTNPATPEEIVADIRLNHMSELGRSFDIGNDEAAALITAYGERIFTTLCARCVDHKFYPCSGEHECMRTFNVPSFAGCQLLK